MERKNIKNIIDVSVIIVSYKSMELLEECLDSLIKVSKYFNYELLVIDNYSRDERVDD